MKFFSTVTIFALLAGNAAGFSAVAPKSTPAAAANGGAADMEPIDKTMKGIDAKGQFDPTEGENPALKRNNNDGVWVDQVRQCSCQLPFCSLQKYIQSLTFS